MHTYVLHPPSHLTFLDWMEWNIYPHRDRETNGVWTVVFSVCVWNLWKWRNGLVFRGLDVPLALKIYRILHSLRDLFSLLLTVVDTGVSSLVHGLMDRVDSTASWMVYLKPSVKSEGRCAGGGGVIRNCEGRWQCGFSVHLGQCLVP